MEQQPESVEQSFNIVVKGPKGEMVSFSVSPIDTAASLKERLLTYYSFAPYSCYHFEVDTKPGRMPIDEMTEFSQNEYIKEGSVFFLVCDQYNTLAARNHIKQTVASVSGNLPLLGLLLNKQDDEIPASLLAYHKLLTESEKDKPIVLEGNVKESYFDRETVEKDQSLKVEIVKPTFPAKFDLQAFNDMKTLLTEKKYIPLKSLHMSAYNPPSSNRKLVGDLLYLRVITHEEEVLHLTSCTSGFFVNESTDSEFNPAASAKYPATYTTLTHLFIAVSPIFSAWYTKRVQEGNQTETSCVEDMLCSLRTMPSSNVDVSQWFGNEQSTKDIHDLFTHAETILTKDNLPFLTADVSARRDWVAEYANLDAFCDDEMSALFCAIDRENEFAEHAKRAVMKIVDEAVAPMPVEGSKDMYLVDDITFMRVPVEKEGGFNRTMVNYQVLSASAISSARVKDLHTPLLAVVDYKGCRFLAQTLVPGLLDRPTTSIILSGSMDGCATLYNDSKVQPQLKNLAEKLHWAPSLIHVQPTEEATPAELPATAAPAASKPLEVKADQAVEFLGPVDGKLLRGVDGNVYAVDFIRSQPVDTYWIQEQVKRTSHNTSQAILRPELVEQFMARRMESEQQAKAIRELLAAKEKGEKVEGLTDEQIETLKKQVEIIEKSVEEAPSKFDVNVFTPFSATTLAAQTNDNADTTQEHAVLLLSNFLIGQMVPSIRETMKTVSFNSQDGSKLVQIMHSSGVNVRYLGVLAGLCFNESAEKTPVADAHILRACENEMVARMAKHLVNWLLTDPALAAAPGYAVAAVLNALVQASPDTEISLEGARKARKGKSVAKVPAAIVRALAENNISGKGVWVQLRQMVDNHFHYTLRVWGEAPEAAFVPTEADRVVLLRRVCTLLGVRLQARHYDMKATFVVSPSDVEAFSPRVKHARTSALDDSLMAIFSEATMALQQGNFANAFVLCRQVIISAVSAGHFLHPLIVRALSAMGTSLFIIRDYVNAVKYTRLALVCAERVFGADALEVAVCHTQLSESLRKAGAPHEAILHAKASLDIYLMACGDRSEDIGNVYASLGLLYKDLVFNDKAVACLEIALKKISKENDYYQEVITGLSQCYALLGNWSSASKYEQMVLEVLKAAEKKDEKAIEESEKKIKEYNTKVMMKMSMRSLLG